MKTPTITTAALLTILLLAGCHSTRTAVREKPDPADTKAINALYEHRTNTAPPRPISFPIRLAVARFDEAVAPETFRAALEKERRLFTQVSCLPLWVNPQGDDAILVANLRRLARDVDAEYLLVIGASIDTSETSNFLSVLDLTLVGGAIIPSKAIAGEGRANGLLVEVESGQLVMLVNAGLKKSSLTPSCFASDRSTAISQELRDKLLARLGKEFVKQLQNRTASTAGADQALNFQPNEMR